MKDIPGLSDDRRRALKAFQQDPNVHERLLEIARILSSACGEIEVGETVDDATAELINQVCEGALKFLVNRNAGSEC